MTADAGFAMDYESLVDTDEALEGMMARLREILDGPPLTQDGFVEIAAIYNNVAYIFLYLESNDVHVDYQRVLPWRDAFYKNVELDTRVLAGITPLRCDDADVEESRRAYVDYLLDKLRDPGPEDDELESLHAQAKSVIAAAEADQYQVLTRLGIPTGSGRPGTTFYKLVSTTGSAATRTQLNRVWIRARDRSLAAQVEIVDRMVDVRRRLATARGYETVLARTLTDCRVDEATASAYLDGYLVKALDSHADLATEVHEALGSTGDMRDHFPYYVRTLLKRASVPTFDLDECLAFIFFVAEQMFGMTLTRSSASSEHVITVEADVDGRRCGQIKFDLWDTGPTSRAANTTRGIRNRTNWAGLVQLPVAYVSCRFRRAEDGRSRINFQNMHSLFHEFGHAVNHLLIRKRLPNQSGLEYLPLERLENLSMWFEKWVYHPELAERLSLTAEDAVGLDLAQRVKMLEYRRSHVERAVLAALDFEIHRRTEGGLRESFAAVDERFAVSRFCSLGDFPGYFSWPMFQANPGANFAYLWGAADSAEKFEPLLNRRIEDSPPPAEVRALFSACFDYDEPSTEPDSASVFRFYDPSSATVWQPNR